MGAFTRRVARLFAATSILLLACPLPGAASVRHAPMSVAYTPARTVGGSGGSGEAACPVGYLPSGSVRGVELCAHATIDPPPSRDMSDGAPGERATSSTAAHLTPHCYGNGVSGNRVELLYVVRDQTAHKHAEWSPRLLSQVVPALEGLVRVTSKTQGGEMGVRFHMPACQLGIELVRLPAEVMAPEPDVFTQTDRIVEALARLGFDLSDRKYLAWIEGLPAPDNRPGSPLGGLGPCGIATGAVMESRPLPNPFDQPTATNYHDGLVPMYALIYRSPAAAYPPFLCWGLGSTGADTELHELFHTLGAVQLSAPNSNGLAHCTDGPDVMCYPEFGKKVENRCFRSTSKVLDCNGDDYFNVAPPDGSYLSTHWNTAKSSFLGDSPLDALPFELRRQ
ncbi:MAG TPA: hypothetical protein VMY88_00250 [Acidimicrobiales bacterium]|nr:hypothetical protein [Acidimicrobiales bacterium]